MSASLPPPASPDRQGSAPAEPVVRSRSPRPLQAKTGGGEDDTDLIPPHLQVPPGRSALLSITPQITMTPRPPSVTSPSLLTGNVLPIPALRAMTGSRVASVPRLPHSSPPLHCTHTARHNFLLPTSDAATGPWPRQTHPFPPRCAPPVAVRLRRRGCGCRDRAAGP